MKSYSYKGFDKDLKCSPNGNTQQYEIGQSYETDQAICCRREYHSCLNPLDVLSYYPPGKNRYFEVEADGEISNDNDDTKIASTKLKIVSEIGLKGLINAGIKFIFEKVTNDPNTKTAYSDSGHAASQGDSGHAEVSGKDSIAAAFGIEGKAKGALGCWLMLAEWEQDANYDWHIKAVKTAKVDGVLVRPDTWYMLQGGEFVETAEVTDND